MTEVANSQTWVRQRLTLFFASIATFGISIAIAVSGQTEGSVLGADSAVMVSAPLLGMALLVKDRVIGLVGLLAGGVAASALGYSLLASNGSTAGIGLLYAIPAVLGIVLVTAAVERARNNRQRHQASLNNASTVASRVVAFVIDVAAIAVVIVVATNVLFDGVYSTPSAIVATCLLFLYPLIGTLAISATLGQRALGLTIINTHGSRQPSLLALAGRSLMITLEIAGAVLLPLIIVVDFILLTTSGRSFADRVFQMDVVFSKPSRTSPAISANRI
jgi:uncharacterized RDD family membrane protein YckC